MSDSRSDAIEIRGLVPWLESGALGAVLLAVARWYETTDMHTRVKLTLNFWDVSFNQTVNRLPSVDIAIGWDKARVGRASCQVKAWEGASPEKVVAACAERLTAVKAAARQSEGSMLRRVPVKSVEVYPGEEGARSE